MNANHVTHCLANRTKSRAGPLIFSGCVLLLSACASTGAALSDAASKPLEYVGLIESKADEHKTRTETALDKKDLARARREAALRAAIRSVDITLSAGPNLNVDASGHALSLVVRIYTLRDAVALSQAPYAAFIDAAREAEAFGSDVVKGREVILTPGQRIATPQEIGSDVNALAIVALFRNPAHGRWRMVFDLKQAARDGIVVGASACALTVSSGLSGLDPAGVPLHLLPAQCPQP